MVIGSCVYAPISEVMNNIAALFYLDVRISRMNEMEALPVQHGTTDFTPKGYDIEFQQVDFAYEQGKQILKNLSFTARQGDKNSFGGSFGQWQEYGSQVGSTFLGYSVGKDYPRRTGYQPD